MKIRRSCEQTFPVTFGYLAFRQVDRASLVLRSEVEYTPCLHPPPPRPPRPPHRGIPPPVLLSHCPLHLRPRSPPHSPPPPNLGECSGRDASIDSRDQFKKPSFQ